MIQEAKQEIFSLATQFALCDVEDTIVVSGAPRSGTTWLAELLRELPSYKMLNEPLNISSSALTKDIEGVQWRTYLEKGTSFPELHTALYRALTGDVDALWMWRFHSDRPSLMLYEHLSHQKLVVKIIRASRMLGWLSDSFPVRAIVHTFRHPCAVVASQMNYKAVWSKASPPSAREMRDELGAGLPDKIWKEIQPATQYMRTAAGTLALVWAIDALCVLQYPVHRPFVVTTYEDLLLDTKREVKRILDLINELVPQNMLERFEVPSHSASQSLETGNVSKQLVKWKDILSTDQIDEVLTITQQVGIEFYTEQPMPEQPFLREQVKPAQ
ncbi:hypothetical protein CRI93_09475 [Longimonas halophila]|uniref:Sulfotransferase domain-containing protein n=1 Tax=Longimonas halophila TaxID=1469170 RepID=A0A2H3P4B9_9BACT|nr:sulfotransferase [Longimonas halophila]PEN06502.1 hypothetical protein CRI93_09475 [Longimonas halophila]